MIRRFFVDIDCLRPGAARSRRRAMWAAALLLAGVGFLFVAVDRAAACPFCVDSVAETGAGGTTDAGITPASTVSQGYNYSIYFMIGMIYVVLGGTGGLLWHAMRNYAPPQHLLMGEAPTQPNPAQTPANEP